jgi:8-amino-7-oxononanoate synthase
VPSFDAELQTQLAALREQGLRRQLRCVHSPQGVHIRVGDRVLLNFSSNDYLGLANHPALKEAATKALNDFGAGTGASRLICGSLAPFHELEGSLAAFKGSEAALTFSTGYAAALGTITALLGKDDIIVLDRLSHACIVDAARLSGAKLRVFRHNDLDDLESILKWATVSPTATKTSPRVLIATESVFSMDGDLSPLRQLVELKNRFGAWLMLDEAHATGVFGPNGSGRAQQEGVGDQIEIQMGTLGKALGAAGGYICGSRALVDLLINRARSFIFSTAPVPASAAAAAAGVELACSREGALRRERLWALVPRLAATLELNPTKSSDRSPILPWIVGEESLAVESADRLRVSGIHVPAIRFPTVARGSARLRFTLTADHSEQELDRLAAARPQIVNRKPSIDHASAGPS